MEAKKSIKSIVHTLWRDEPLGTPVRESQFNIHLTGLNGPVSQILQRPTGRCMFAGPVYSLPPLMAPFGIYAGYLDSVCDDLIFAAILYGEATPNTIEGEILVYQLVSVGDMMKLQELTSSEIEAMFTFNRRALHRCVFWARLREGTMDEESYVTQRYAHKEFKQILRLFQRHRRKKLRQMTKARNFHNFFELNLVPLKNDGVFLSLTDRMDCENENSISVGEIPCLQEARPIDLSVVAVRVYRNEILFAFITLPKNLGLLRFLEKFASFDVKGSVGVYDSVLGVCVGTAERKNDKIYRVHQTSKWKTNLEVEIIDEEEIILRHKFKGVCVLEQKLLFCHITSDGVAFPKGVLPPTMKLHQTPKDIEIEETVGCLRKRKVTKTVSFVNLCVLDEERPTITELHVETGEKISL